MYNVLLHQLEQLKISFEVAFFLWICFFLGLTFYIYTKDGKKQKKTLKLLWQWWNILLDTNILIELWY